MNTETDLQRMSEILKNKFGCEKITSIKTLGGGTINSSFLFETDKGSFFVKSSSLQTKAFMFAAEAECLRALQKTGIIRTPNVLDVGFLLPAIGFIVLEYIGFWNNYC